VPVSTRSSTRKEMRMSEWVDQIFGADQAKYGGVVRRKKEDVEKYASMAELIQEVRSRRFHLIETGDQVVIICNPGSIQLHC
jgi:hypothetical protein